MTRKYAVVVKTRTDDPNQEIVVLEIKHSRLQAEIAVEAWSCLIGCVIEEVVMTDVHVKSTYSVNDPDDQEVE